MKTNYKIIVPIYNGSRYLTQFIRSFTNEQQTNLLLVNDGSTDKTAEIGQSFEISMLHHPTNLGKGYALQNGLSTAFSSHADYCITMDCDLQHPVDKIPEFISLYEPSMLIIGNRKNRKNMPMHRVISNYLTSLFISVRTNTVVKDSQCGYRLIPKKIRTLVLKESGFQYESELVIKSLLSGIKLRHITIPTIYGDERSAIRGIRETIRFTNLWLRSFFW